MKALKRVSKCQVPVVVHIDLSERLSEEVDPAGATDSERYRAGKTVVVGVQSVAERHGNDCGAVLGADRADRSPRAEKRDTRTRNIRPANHKDFVPSE